MGICFFGGDVQSETETERAHAAHIRSAHTRRARRGPDLSIARVPPPVFLTHDPRPTSDAALTPAEASSALACIPRRPGDAPTSALASLAGGRTAADLLAVEAASRRVITFCAALDELLGGGVQPGQVTEFCECARVQGRGGARRRVGRGSRGGGESPAA